MSLSKQQSVDLIEITEENFIQVRVATRIIENDNIISESFHRHTIVPGDDYSNETEKVKNVCNVIHTEQVVANYETKKLKVIE